MCLRKLWCKSSKRCSSTKCKSDRVMNFGSHCGQPFEFATIFCAPTAPVAGAIASPGHKGEGRGDPTKEPGSNLRVRKLTSLRSVPTYIATLQTCLDAFPSVSSRLRNTGTSSRTCHPSCAMKNLFGQIIEMSVSNTCRTVMLPQLAPGHIFKGIALHW